MHANKKARATWVVKVGSNILIEGGPLLVRAYAEQLARLRREEDVQVVWVTSGAIASARARTGRQHTALAEKQALSAIGQPLLMDTYNLALQSQGLMGAQVLLSYDDIKDGKRCVNLKNTLTKLLEWNVVPLLNENDAVATEEIQFGDNDMLSALVADLIKADRLLLLTNVEGLFDKDPTRHKDAQLIHRLDRITDATLKKIDTKSISTNGRGGMHSKIRAAAHAQKSGIDVWLLKGDIPHILVRVARDEEIGTRITAAARKATARKVKRKAR